MPLIKSGSREAISTNIKEMVAAGHPRRQAIAAALSTARRYGKKYADGGDVPDDSDHSLEQAYDPQARTLRLTVRPQANALESTSIPEGAFLTSAEKEAARAQYGYYPKGKAEPRWQAPPLSTYRQAASGIDTAPPPPPEASPAEAGPGLADRLFGLHGQERYHTAPERLLVDPVRDTIRAAQSGAFDVNAPPGIKEQGIQANMDLTQAMAGGIRAAGAVAPGLIPENAAGMFVGRLQPQQVERAAALRAAGASQDEIWLKTGVHADPYTGALMREIPDRDVKLNMGLLEPDKAGLGMVGVPPGKTIKLGDLYPHEELFNLYPWAKDISVEGMPRKIRPDGATTVGHADWLNNRIILAPMSPQDMKSAITHEVQHFIQFHEGMTPGGSAIDFVHPRDQVKAAQLMELNAKLTADLQKAGIPIDDAAMAVKRFNVLYKQNKLDQLSMTDRQILTYLKHIGKIDDIVKLNNASAEHNRIMGQAFLNYQRIYGEAMARATETRMNRSPLENELEHPESTMEVMQNAPVYSKDTMPSLRAPDQPWNYDPQAYRAFHGVEPPAAHTARPAASESIDLSGEFEKLLNKQYGTKPEMTSGDIVNHLTGLEESLGRELEPAEIAQHLIDFAKAGNGDAALKAKKHFPAALKKQVNKAIFALKKNADADTLDAINALYWSKKLKKKDITKGLVPEPNPEDFDIPEQAQQGVDEEYYKAQERQAMAAQAPEWKPEGEEEAPDLFEDMFSQPQAKHLPKDIFEKAQVIGLNQPGYHGAPTAFEAFKLPEELPPEKFTLPSGEKVESPRRPEIGIHFGTVRAANHRLTHLGMYPGSKKSEWSEWHIIPAIIKAQNPLRLPDLGTWKADNIAWGLKNSSLIPKHLVDEAMNVPPSPKPWKGHYDWEQEVKQINNLRNLLESRGYDSIAYRNNVEDPGSISYITWRKNHVRSFYAKFDPKMKDLAHLAASIGGLGVFAMGASRTPSDQEEEPMKRATGGSTPFHERAYNESIGAPTGIAEPGVRHFATPRIGMIHSAVPGRTDKLSMNVKGGSYILPASVVSGIGQGNSQAGAAILNSFFKQGPYGAAAGRASTPKVNYGRSMSMHLPTMKMPKFSAGGEEGDEHDKVPIVAAGGEYVIAPEVVKRLGGGDMKEGHRILDHFVMHARRKTIQDMRKERPPKR